MSEVKSLLSILSKIRKRIGTIFTYYFEIITKYYSIDKSQIDKELKKYLIARLNAITTEYYLLIESPNEYKEVCTDRSVENVKRQIQN